MTTGDTMMIPYNNKKYYINVVETKPSTAVSIIETDCEVDFAPPLDYKEPEKKFPSALCDHEHPEGRDSYSSVGTSFKNFLKYFFLLQMSQQQRF